ncbi:hypothetical protein BRADI_3g50401v3 [Brachypodium distachyon]|uniref:Uncharacterized protein n=1 Tax=Brachypodium distachyon TaxID=15368 RepID=A0A0Q3FLV3_BRADI|nr:hypothetical protein BRADI_3g50401v3 [Brachypodium distachyon]
MTRDRSLNRTQPNPGPPSQHPPLACEPQRRMTRTLATLATQENRSQTTAVPPRPGAHVTQRRRPNHAKWRPHLLRTPLQSFPRPPPPRRPKKTIRGRCPGITFPDDKERSTATSPR